MKNLQLIEVLIRNQNGQKIFSQIFHNVNDEYGKYDELCSKINLKFKSNLNLPGDLNEKHTAYLHHIVTFQFSDFS